MHIVISSIFDSMDRTIARVKPQTGRICVFPYRNGIFEPAILGGCSTKLEMPAASAFTLTLKWLIQQCLCHLRPAVLHPHEPFKEHLNLHDNGPHKISGEYMLVRFLAAIVTYDCRTHASALSLMSVALSLSLVSVVPFAAVTDPGLPAKPEPS